ncbi:S9 family peptidase [Novosphingobium sp. Gsoil 351]|uniref:alpha/beta hydrolase family protein n=1 Tax=Novosphingobium sp. Gsoil 351 TaxID=2675225 RepID=UPI0012B4ECE4|nr:hypothetical protein [Novosphingobium sp. Gsoil 351]QGN55865.1 hypothetical protein GKE62_16210 [Novosphingobium sp. Gsoil 351]
MKNLLLRCLALAAVLIAAPVSAQDIRMEVIQLTGDPPGHVREAPGGGRILAPGVLYTPAGGGNPHGPAIVMLDGGPGEHTLGHDQITRFAAERLAAQGYTVLSLYGYQERSFPLIPFADTIWPIDTALTWLENAGYEDFALAGQGYGALAAAQYLATHPDTLLDNGGQKRVRALILYNPLTNLRKYPRAMLDGGGYDAKVARAEASVASGRGLIPENLEPGQGEARRPTRGSPRDPTSPLPRPSSIIGAPRRRNATRRCWRTSRCRHLHLSIPALRRPRATSRPRVRWNSPLPTEAATVPTRPQRGSHNSWPGTISPPGPRSSPARSIRRPAVAASCRGCSTRQRLAQSLGARRSCCCSGARPTRCNPRPIGWAGGWPSRATR